MLYGAEISGRYALFAIRMQRIVAVYWTDKRNEKKNRALCPRPVMKLIARNEALRRSLY